MTHFFRTLVAASAIGWLLLATPATAAEGALKPMDVARMLNRAFVDLADQVSPSVVVIQVIQKPGAVEGLGQGHPLLEMFPEEWREELERRFRSDREGGEGGEGQPRRRNRRPAPTGQGSGVIIRADGYILTNHHVVEDADEIKVRLKDGREFKAELAGTDQQSDVAVIKLKEPPADLRAAKLADSDQVRVGEFAVAIGAPFELDYSVTFGHVSAKGRTDVVPGWMGGGAMDQDFIQTDANINPGNSGGPLVNIDGEVIGINSIIRGLSTGIGFAIPSNLAKEISERLISDGKFTRSWLGINIGALREDEDYQAMLKDIADGVVVISRLAGSPAARSELKEGDVITAVDGVTVKTPSELRALVSRKRPGQEVTLDVHRLGKNLQVKISPEAWPEEMASASPRPRRAPAEAETMFLGIKVKPLDADAAEEAGLKSGVVVTEVSPDSVAAERGIAVGDVITEINHEPVDSPRKFRELLKDANLKEGVLFNLSRDGQRTFRVLKDSGEE